MLYGRDHNLWIGTDGRGVFQRTSSGTINISERAGKFNERIRTMYEDAQGVLWIATQNGVERFVDGKIEVLSEAGMILRHRNAFAGGWRWGCSLSSSAFHCGGLHVAFLFVFRRCGSCGYRDFQRIGVADGRRTAVPRRTTSHDLTDRFYQVPRATVDGPVTVLQDDREGNLWIGTRRDGIWRLGADGTSHWSSRNGLPDDTIRALFIDNEQNLWIGMRTGGLSRWRKGALAPYGEPEGFHANFSANSFAGSHGDLWLGTWGRGLFRRHNGHLSAANPPGMPIATPIRALAEDRRGHIWIGTWFDGIYRYDGHTFHHYLLGIESPGNAVSAILPDSRGGLWVGTYTGLFYFPTGEVDSQRRSHLLEAKLITCVIEDRDGSILVGTSTGFRADGVGFPSTNAASLCPLIDIGQLGTPDGAPGAGGFWVHQRGTRPECALHLFSSTTPLKIGMHFGWQSRGIVRLSLTEPARCRGRSTVSALHRRPAGTACAPANVAEPQPVYPSGRRYSRFATARGSSTRRRRRKGRLVQSNGHHHRLDTLE